MWPFVKRGKPWHSKVYFNLFRTQMVIFNFKIPKLHCKWFTGRLLLFTISKCKTTNIFKESETTREVFPELKSYEAAPEIPEPPRAEGTNSCHKTANKKTFHLVFVKCPVFCISSPTFKILISLKHLWEIAKTGNYLWLAPNRSRPIHTVYKDS